MQNQKWINRSLSGKKKEKGGGEGGVEMRRLSRKRGYLGGKQIKK